MNERSNEKSSEKSGEYKSPDTELKFLEELVKEKTVASNKFKITKGAFNKAMTYAKAIGQLAGTGMECYGYLLKPADGLDDVVTDIFFAPDQTTQSAYVRVSAEGVYQSSQEIEPRGMMIVGWWHSHGTFNTFHSGTDVRNFEIVLHSIAPRTMYRNEKGQYTYNAQTKELLINGTKIKGLELPETSQLEIIRKVERDPYAYSMVVNMYRSYYLEKITKTLISREEGFVLNPPLRPALEIVNVENDVKYTISEIEDDITSKVELQGRFSNGFYNGLKRSTPVRTISPVQQKSIGWGPNIGWNSNRYNSNKRYAGYMEDPESNNQSSNQSSNNSSNHGETISKFVERLKDGTPECLTGFVDGIMTKEKSLLSRLSRLDGLPANSQADHVPAHIPENTDPKGLSDLSDLLVERFEDVSERYSANQVYDIQRLREELALHFVSEYSNNPSLDVVKKYARINSAVSNKFDVCVNAGKALAKYSMERFTDYDDECKHKYKNFIGHFLDNMNTENYVAISSSFKASKNSRYDRATDRLFLYEDRLKIINNMMTTLAFSPEESRFKPFFTEFAEEYQKDPASEKLDSIIEQKLLSIMDAGNFSSYADRPSYERKGVLGKIFSDVRNYFGGAKNVG